jgi:hypothetical protein
MRLWWRRARREHSSPEDSANALAGADYDAQTDLALPTTDDHRAADGFVPFAGELAPQADDAGYDVARDTGIDPG